MFLIRSQVKKVLDFEAQLRYTLLMIRKENAMKVVIKAEDVSRRNPVAAELASGKFRNQVVRDRKKYTRKAKHKNRLTSGGF